MKLPIAKKLQSCSAVEHTVSDNGKTCLCGYFIRLTDRTSNPYNFEEMYPELDLVDFHSEEAYEMGVSAGWNVCNGKEIEAAPTGALPPGLDTGREDYYSDKGDSIIKKEQNND